jgi:hypothetical protein
LSKPLQHHVQVLFQPRTATAYAGAAELAAQLPHEDAPLPILALDLAGAGRQPRLAFDTGHVLLPAVPLHVQSSATFRVITDGYDNLDLKVRLPSDTANLPLELKFPEGTLVGIAKASIPVVVTFAAGRSTSFTANIEFLDQDGARAPVLPSSVVASACGTTLSTSFAHCHLLLS